MSRVEGWLPPGKRAAICFSIDDIHPGTSRDAYEAGGDLGNGALGHVARLLDRHPQLKVTLFTTPDWREISSKITRPIVSRIPIVRDRVYLSDVLPPGAMRLDRHPAFVRYLKSLPRTDVGLHGLHHIHVGRSILIEFQDQTVEQCVAILDRAMQIFHDADLPIVKGITPPGWNAPPALIAALPRAGLQFIGSARDIRTPVEPGVRANMSGLKDVLLFEPERLSSGAIHIPANFQATSRKERAFEIIEAGGLLSVKAHIVKNFNGIIALDGVDELYCNYLDSLFTLLDAKYGEQLWWPSMSELAERCLAQDSPMNSGMVA